MKTLYMSDLDGTLLKSDKTISEYSLNTINEAMEKGALFSVATARSFVSAHRLIKGLNVNAPMVMMNGVFIYDKQKDEYLKYEQIDKKTIHHIVELFDKYKKGGRMFAFDGKKLIVYTVGENLRNFSEDEDFENEYRKIVYVKDFISHCDDYPIVSFVLIDSFENLRDIFADLRYNPDVSPCFYQDIYHPENYWLEIYSGNVNKANAVNYVKEYLKADRLTVFGDNINDIPMLEEADNAVCVYNAISKAKDNANTLLTLTNDEDAVAKYMGKLFEVK